MGCCMYVSMFPPVLDGTLKPFLYVRCFCCCWRGCIVSIGFRFLFLVVAAAAWALPRCYSLRTG